MIEKTGSDNCKFRQYKFIHLFCFKSQDILPDEGIPGECHEYECHGHSSGA